MSPRRLGMIVAVGVMVLIAYTMRDMPGDDRIVQNDEAKNDAGAASDIDGGPQSPPSPAAPPAPLPTWMEVFSASTTARDVGSADSGRMEGRIIDRRSRVGIPASLTFAFGDTVVTVESDREGSFTLSPDAAGEYRLISIQSDGYYPFAPTWGHSPVRFVAEPNRIVSGVVLALEPRAPLSVSIVPAGEEGEECTLDVRGLPVDSPLPLQSRYTFESGQTEVEAPEGSVLQVHCTGGADERFGRARVESGAQIRGELTIRLGTTSHQVLGGVRGRVVDESGAPIRDALVEVQDERDSLSAHVRVLTDADGRFEAGGVGRGLFAVWASRPGYAGEGREDVEPGAEIELVLAPESSIEGQVLDESGHPVTSFVVMAVAHIGPLERAFRGSAMAFDAEGRFRLGGLTSGRYDLHVRALGLSAAEQEVELRRGENRQLTPLSLERGRVLRGHVRDDGGGPIADARVRVETQFEGVQLGGEILSDTAGEFEMAGLAEGPVTLLVNAEGYHSRLFAVASEVAETNVILTAVEEGEESGLELTGIGAVLRAEGDALIVDQVLEGAGAHQAGLGPTDAVLRIDGESVVDLGFAGSIGRIRGPEGSVVLLDVRRGDSEEQIPVRRLVVRASSDP